MAVYDFKQRQNIPAAAYVVVVLLLLIYASFYTVEQGSVGIKLRFGALVGVEPPGIGFKIPFVETVRPMSVRTEKVAFPRMEAYSRDIQAAQLQISMNYHIDPSKAGDVYSELGLNYVPSLIMPLTTRITKEIFGQFNAQNIISERTALGAEIEKTLNEQLAAKGIVVEGYQMEDVAFSDAFDQSIEARMQAEVEVAKLKQNLEREKVQADINRAQAMGKADALRSQAQAEADAITLRGEAEAKAIHARAEALKTNPEMVQLIQAERWNGVLPQTMVPNNTVPMLNVK